MAFLHWLENIRVPVLNGIMLGITYLGDEIAFLVIALIILAFRPHDPQNLFVNKVATNKNTRVVCNRDSLTWSSPKPTWGEWMQQKRRHLSVSPLYRVSSKLRIGVEPMMRALLYGLLILCALYGTWSLYVALGVWGLRYLVQWIILRVATWRLGMKKFGGEMVLYDLVLPIITLSILITKKLRRVPVYW